MLAVGVTTPASVSCRSATASSRRLKRVAPGDRVAYYAPATVLGGTDKLQSFVSIGVVQRR